MDEGDAARSGNSGSPYVLRRRPSSQTTPSPHQPATVVRHSPYPQRRTTPTPYVVSGDSFPDIMQQLWEKYKQLANGATTLDEWRQVMQFRYKRHPLESERRVEWWNNWLVSARGETVQLLIYHLFQKACIQPREVDRSGAPAEAVIRDAVQELQGHWGRTYRAEAMVWRMWAIKITANRDRSTWAALTKEPDPASIARHLRPANSVIETYLTTMNHSAKLALECVDAMLLQFGQLERDFTALANRFSVLKSSLEAPKVTIEGFVRNVLPVPVDEVEDPTETMENINDDEHEE